MIEMKILVFMEIWRIRFYKYMGKYLNDKGENIRFYGNSDNKILQICL